MSTAATLGATPAARDPAATIAALHQALTLLPDNIDVMVALAGLYLKTGRLNDAAEWCAKALTRKPEHAPALKVRRVIGDALVETGMRVAVSGDLATCIDVFSRAAIVCAHDEARHYLALFRQTAAWFEAAKSVPRAETSTRLSIAVWGDSYLAAATTSFRSLLAPGNIPALAERGPVILEIATSEDGRAALEASPVIAALRAHVHVEYFVLGRDILDFDRTKLPGFPYWIMAAAHYATVRRAHFAGSHVSFFGADSIFADGSLRAVRDYIDAGKLAVLAGALEVDGPAVLAAVGDDGQRPIIVSPRALTEHALIHLHPDQLALICAPDQTATAPIPNPLMFRTEHGLVQFGFHLLPLMISATLLAREFAPDFLTCDTRMVRLALGTVSPQDLVQIVDDSDRIAAVSTSRQMPKGLAAKPFEAENLGAWASRWCFESADVPFFEWCFRQRRAMRGSGATGHVAPPTAFETATIEAVLSAFRRLATERVARRRRASSRGPRAVEQGAHAKRRFLPRIIRAHMNCGGRSGLSAPCRVAHHRRHERSGLRWVRRQTLPTPQGDGPRRAGMR